MLIRRAELSLGQSSDRNSSDSNWISSTSHFQKPVHIHTKFLKAIRVSSQNDFLLVNSRSNDEL